jgi:RNA polymerase sigma factor (sigma-70 family)
MEMSDADLQLLRQYTRHNAEDAFAEVVRRHLDLVFSAALRQVRSPQLAEEVAQSVFIELARRAGGLAAGTILSAWLYHVTRCTAIDVVRREARRQIREQVAWELTTMNATAADWVEIGPLLDEAMDALGDTDRTAVLLRYFENKSLREVGQRLDMTEEAARKRVSRAIESLRTFFSKRGATLGASGLIIAISANAVQSAPIGLAARISAGAILGLKTSTVAAITRSTTMKTIQKTLTSAVVAALGVSILQAHRASSLRNQNQLLQQQGDVLAQEIQQLQQERSTAADRVAALRDSEATNRNNGELLKLRGEVARLRRELAEATGTKAQSFQATEPNDALEKQKRMARVKGMDAFLYVSAFIDYASHNQGQFPTNWSQVASSLTNNPNGPPTGTNEFEIVYQGPLNRKDLTTNIILIREYLAWPTVDGKWGKVYGFAGGNSEIHFEPDGDFTSWEKQFMPPDIHSGK